jgi:hypothetical protein
VHVVPTMLVNAELKIQTIIPITIAIPIIRNPTFLFSIFENHLLAI